MVVLVVKYRNQVKALRIYTVCFLYEMNSSVQDYNNWARRKVKAITYLSKLFLYQADCCGYPWSLVCGVSLPSVSDLNRQWDNYDVYSACHCVRTKCHYSYGSALFTIVHSYTTRRLRRFADSLNAHRRGCQYSASDLLSLRTVYICSISGQSVSITGTKPAGGHKQWSPCTLHFLYVFLT